MATGRKTGGQIKGVSFNKPKVPTPVATTVEANVEAAGGAGAPPGGILFAMRGGARARGQKSGQDSDVPGHIGKEPFAVVAKSIPPAAREATAPAFPKYRLARVDSLMPNERNARIHTRESVDALARQIGEVGWTNSILVAGRQNTILAGHRRRLAALQRKMEFVPVIDLGHLSAQQRRAYIIWDNKSTIDGDWDEELLTIELGELRGSGFDLSLTGFDAGELSALFDEPGPPAAPPKRTTTKSVECPKCHHEFAP